MKQRLSVRNTILKSRESKVGARRYDLGTSKSYLSGVQVKTEATALMEGCELCWSGTTVSTSFGCSMSTMRCPRYALKLATAEPNHRKSHGSETVNLED